MDWTDERLQERFDSIDHRFDEVDRRFDQVDKRFEQVDKRFEQVDKRFEQVDRRFDKVEGELKDGLKGLDAKIDAKFDGLQRTLMAMGGGIIATLIACVVTLLATQL